MILPVITYPNKNLRLKSKELSRDEILAKKMQDLIDNMKETMLEKDGVGLAAPQIDQRVRLVVIKTDDGVEEFLNPKIVSKSWSRNVMDEGCLSVPGVFGLVRRPKRIKVNYLDREGNKKTVSDDYILARVLQHEIDHLDGILFIDKILEVTEGEDKLEEYGKKV